MELYAVRPTDRERFYVSSALREWTGPEISSLLLVPTLPAFAHYRNLVLKGAFRTLIFTIARTEFAVCALIQFISAALAGFSETFNCNSHLIASSPSFIGLSSALPDLVQLVMVRSSFHGPEFDLVSSFSVWHTMRAFNWVNVFPIAGSRWLPYDCMQGLVFGLPSPGQACVVVNGRDTYTRLHAVPSVSLLRDLPSWTQVCEGAVHHFRQIHKTAHPKSFPNTPVLLETTPLTGTAQLGSSDQSPVSSSPRSRVPQSLVLADDSTGKQAFHRYSSDEHVEKWLCNMRRSW